MSAGDRAEQTLAAGIVHHRAGRLADAERLYRIASEADPRNARAFHLWGVVAHQLKRPDASSLVARAVALDPSFAEAHNDRGVILAADGLLSDALASFERAVALRPSYDEARNNFARGLRSLGLFDEAAKQFGVILQSAPASPVAHFNLATAYELGARPLDAEQHYRKSISLRPHFVDAHVQLASLLQQADRPMEALVHAERAAALRPDIAGLRNNLGNILRALGQHEEAIAQYETALRIDPNSFMAHYNYGVALRNKTRIAEARQHFARALAIKPEFLEAELALCMAELPALYQSQSRIVEQREAYARRLAELSSRVERATAPAALSTAIGSHQPFYLPYQGFNDRDLQILYGSLVCKTMAARFTAPVLPMPPGPQEPIRLGIVSGFFRQHSNWKIPVKGWLKNLDRSRFHVTGYYTCADRDGETEAAAALCERFVQGPLSLDAWRFTILEDAPHILIFPEIGMDKVTAQLAAQRLARVQCCSWGHPVTSGLPTIDYFISSDLMEPRGAAAHYSEQLIRLPNLSFYYEPADVPLVGIERAHLGLRAASVVYWCCQSLPKYLPQFDEVFARIAVESPGCQFTFIEFQGSNAVTEMFRARLDAAFRAVGLDATDHCVFLPRLAPDLFVAAIGHCDVVLDSIGWSGCNSVLESLVHNVPIVTFAGEMMRGRHSAAILELMDISAMTARTVDEYVSIAGSLGRNKGKRAEISAQIAQRKHRVFRDRHCVTGLEAFLERVARSPETHCEYSTPSASRTAGVTAGSHD